MFVGDVPVGSQGGSGLTERPMEVGVERAPVRRLERDVRPGAPSDSPRHAGELPLMDFRDARASS
ncbi:MAG TPA: hypothetical protein VMF89_34410 [Polyangiales bacterium]|nr:hypothetical protein [Polyangiales bacterium]